MAKRELSGRGKGIRWAGSSGSYQMPSGGPHEQLMISAPWSAAQANALASENEPNPPLLIGINRAIGATPLARPEPCARATPAQQVP